MEGNIHMAMSPQKLSSGEQRRPFLRLRPVRLQEFSPEGLQREIQQRRDESRQMEDHYKRQVTGAFWRYASGVHRATGSHSALLPPFTREEIEAMPTQEMRSLSPKTTDKIPAYHEPCSDEFSIEDLRIPLEIQSKLNTSIQEHGGRYPNAIRLNPFVIELLKLMHECEAGRYKGLIPLVADPELALDGVGIQYL